MKKLFVLLLAALILLTSCSHFVDAPETSVWSGGLWIIPWFTFLGGVFFFILAYKASRSGSKQQQDSGGYSQSDENVPIYKLGFFYFSVILFVATVVIIIGVNGSR